MMIDFTAPINPNGYFSTLDTLLFCLTADITSFCYIAYDKMYISLDKHPYSSLLIAIALGPLRTYSTVSHCLQAAKLQG